MTVLQIIRDALTGARYHYFSIGDDLAVGLIHCGETGIYFPIILGDDETEALAVHCHYETLVPTENRNAIAEFITRVNYTMRLGYFNLNLDSGMVTFRYTVKLKNSELVQSMVIRALALAIGMLDKYRAGFASILYKNTTPEAAYQKSNNSRLNDETNLTSTIDPDNGETSNSSSRKG